MKNVKMRKLLGMALGGSLLAMTSQIVVAEEEATVNFKSMAPSIALELAQAALKACQDGGYQVTVAVVDRFGILQVTLRDRYAGAHTPETARRKAWTAVSFRSDTASIEKGIKDGELSASMKDIPQALTLGGGVPVQAAGSIVGGIGVSGAPGGAIDHECAQKGIDALADKLEF